jgi:uncharacterized protein YecT (DUF1311 family)
MMIIRPKSSRLEASRMNSISEKTNPIILSMKYLFSLLLCLTCSMSFAQAPAETKKAISLNQESADVELNRIYQQILKDYQSDTAFIAKLKISQRIWIRFRDAELNMKFPDSNPGYYGSIYPECKALYLEELTRVRTKTLMVWLKGIEEGELCRGSVKMAE